jgi:hypothetical protein
MHIEGIINQATITDPDHDTLANVIEEAARGVGHHHIHSADRPPKVELTKRTEQESKVPHRATIITHTYHHDMVPHETHNTTNIRATCQSHTRSYIRQDATCTHGL